MRWLRWLGFGVLGLAAVMIVIAVIARFSDGPLGVWAGGPLESGEWVAERDLSFVAAISTIEFQLLEPPRSRTVWVVVHEGDAYIPCGLPNFRLWKQWPHEAMEDGRAILRIEGKRYERQAVRVTDRATIDAVADEVARKYGVGGAGAADDSFWVFRLDARPDGGPSGD